MDTIKRTKQMAVNVRKNVVRMIGTKGQTGHLGGSFSSADIVAALYSGAMKFDAKNPTWPQRDKFIYSKGHAAIAQYAAMAEAGYFAKDELDTIKKLGARLQGHPDRLKLPGIEAGTGSLGQGLSIANGLALAMKLDKIDAQVFCILGDGELNEGQIWEAAMAASNFRLDNVTAILDRNRLQATGACAERFLVESLAQKWEAFGWDVQEIDGHDMQAILGALESSRRREQKPHMIIANTIKGKGASFAENKASFHNTALSAEQFEIVLAELDKTMSEVQ